MANFESEINSVFRDSISYLENGIIEFDSAYQSPIQGEFLFGTAFIGKNGRRRALKLQGNWPNGRGAGFKAWFRFIDQLPGGQVVAPLRFVGGTSIMKVTASQSLPANARIGFWFFKNDNIIGNPADIRIAQAPTPNGPWTAISNPMLNPPALPVGNIPSGRLSRAGISLANGEYFAIASVANISDVQLVDIYPPARWRAGCGNALRIGAIIRNNGVLPITQVTLIAKNMITGEQVPSIFTLGKPLQSTNRDTVWIENGPQINFLENTILSVKLFLNGDNNAANDSLQKIFNFNAASMPYQEYFTNEVPFYYKTPFEGNPLITLPPAWWANAEFVLGYSVPQAWKSYTFSNSGYLRAYREPNISTPLLAHSPYINVGSGTFELKYSYRWALSGDGPFSPRPADTLSVSYSTDCGQTFQKLDVINRDIHPIQSPIATWISRTAIFEKLDNQPVFIQIKLIMPQGAGGLSVDVDSLRITQITSSEALVQQSKNIRIYPNPSQGKFRLELPENGGIVKVVDIQGREVLIQKLPQGQSNPEIDLKGLGAKGLYFLQWKNEKLAGQVKVLVE